MHVNLGLHSAAIRSDSASIEPRPGVMRIERRKRKLIRVKLYRKKGRSEDRPKGLVMLRKREPVKALRVSRVAGFHEKATTHGCPRLTSSENWRTLQLDTTGEEM